MTPADQASPVSAGPAPAGECPICGGGAEVSFPSLPGYVKPHRYDVMRCCGCGVSYAVSGPPADGWLYESIYRSAWRTPGYHEYSAFADEVLRAPDPLAYLASASAVYWAVARYLDDKPASAGYRVLEVGSGLGYLTSALVTRGFDAVGLDISRRVVDQATRRYGPRFRCGTVRDARETDGAAYRLVVCTEMIEHVEDPVGFLGELVPLLGKGGEVLLTTPNKSAFPDDAVWETDPPPVHRWWFTGKAIEALARKAGFSSVRFLDLADCPVGRIRIDPSRDYRRPACQPILDARGRLCFRGHRSFALRLFLRECARRTRLLARYRNWKDSRRGAAPPPEDRCPSRPANLCAILSP